MDDIEVCEVGKDFVGRQRSFDAKFDLSAIGLEAIADLKAYSADNHPNEMFQLRKKNI